MSTPETETEPDGRRPEAPAPKLKVPKYYRLKQDLQAMIDAGEPGTALPTERELAVRFDTSRTTVRQALAELVVEGKLERTQGRGTFISEPKLITLRQLTSFSEDLAERGTRSHSEILDVSRAPADRQVAEALRVGGGRAGGPRRTAAVRRRRPDRARDGLAARPAPPAARRAGAPRLALPDAARGVRRRDRRRRGLGGDRAGQPAAGPAAAAATPGCRCCWSAGPAWDGAGRPVEFTRSVFRGDRFRFVARRES